VNAILNPRERFHLVVAALYPGRSATGQKQFFTTSPPGLPDFIDIHPQGDRSIRQEDCS